MSVQLPHGSRKNQIAGSDVAASLRTSAMVIVGAAVSYAGTKYFGDDLPTEVQEAIVVVVTFILTLAWKFVTDTTRTSAI